MLRRILNDRAYRSICFAVGSLIFDLCYTFYNGALGLLGHSVWFGATCAYYLLLAIMRFAAVLSREKNGGRGILCLTGLLLSVLSLVLLGILRLSLTQNNAAVHGTIFMITIAAYTFGKLTAAIIHSVRQKIFPSLRLRAIRSIGYAEVLVSVFTMQQSMLVSFEGMDNRSISILNTFTGLAVCIMTLGLGITLIRTSRKGRENGQDT